MPKLLALLAVVLLASCSPDEPAGKVFRLSGKTMGTTYNITAVDVPANLDQADLQKAVDDVLADVNGKMSNWDKKSEVSLLNAAPGGEAIPVSDDFVTIMQAANKVHELTDGKFDVTLGPLIELWGFGPRKPADPIPPEDEIKAALANIGQEKVLTLDPDAKTIRKSDQAVGINLSAIAKGFGIDAVAHKLHDLKIDNYMVEIGGDLVTAGHNDKDESWKIGIEKPETGNKAVELVVPVTDHGLATSGDYRNFFEENGVRYSHIIDPTTGRPITHRTTSVSVMAENAMMADALATALLVVGADKGLGIAEANDIAVYFISRDADGGHVTQMSPAFEKALEKK